jgi:molybdopterin synthase sulfur carrier subunit
MNMSIKVRYFASLKERLGRPDDDLSIANAITVREVWQLANADETLPSSVLAAVNMDYVGLDHLVKDGDEVAFFPPVTGG